MVDEMQIRKISLFLCSLLLAGASAVAIDGDIPAENETTEASRQFGPAPLDSDGRFTNLDLNLPGASTSVRMSFFLRRIVSSFGAPEGAPESWPNDGAFLRENAKHSSPNVTWIGHSTLLVQMEHVTFLTDPIWSDRPSPVSFAGPSRYVDPGVALEDLPPIDFVIISHNHYDHLDLPTLRQLSALNADTVFFVPLGNGDLLRKNKIERVREMDWGDVVAFKGVEVHCLPNQHWSKRSLTDTRKALWASWAITGPGRRFYFAGDTGYFSGFKEIGAKLGPFDLAAVPIGAYEPSSMMKASHMNPEEAVQAALDVKATNAVAIHYGTFKLSDEPINEPPKRFKAAAQDTSLGVDHGWVLKIGETRDF